MKTIVEIEMWKLKNSKILWIVILVPAFMVAQGVINFIRYHDLFTGKGQNAWEQLYSQSMIFYVWILFPVLISLVMTLLARIENANQNWKHYLSLPVSREKIYGIKFLIGCALVLVNVFVLIACMLAAGKVIGVQEDIPYEMIFIQPMAAYVAALPIMAVLYALSIRFSHMAVPLGVGIGLTVPAMIVANTKYWVVYPWTYPIMAALGRNIDIFDKGRVIYLIGILLLIRIFRFGCGRFAKKDIV